MTYNRMFSSRRPARRCNSAGCCCSATCFGIAGFRGVRCGVRRHSLMRSSDQRIEITREGTLFSGWGNLTKDERDRETRILERYLGMAPLELDRSFEQSVEFDQRTDVLT